jgi:hypothetical protein
MLLILGDILRSTNMESLAKNLVDRLYSGPISQEEFDRLWSQIPETQICDPSDPTSVARYDAWQAQKRREKVVKRFSAVKI